MFSFEFANFVVVAPLNYYLHNFVIVVYDVVLITPKVIEVYSQNIYKLRG